jgi:hypothetical protein
VYFGAAQECEALATTAVDSRTIHLADMVARTETQTTFDERINARDNY